MAVTLELGNIERVFASMELRGYFLWCRSRTGWPAAMFQTCAHFGVHQDAVYEALGWNQ